MRQMESAKEQQLHSKLFLRRILLNFRVKYLVLHQIQSSMKIGSTDKLVSDHLLH